MPADSPPVYYGRPRDSDTVYGDFADVAASRSRLPRKHRASGEEIDPQRHDPSQSSQAEPREAHPGLSKVGDLDRQGQTFAPDSAANNERIIPRLLPPIAHLTSAIDRNRVPQMLHKGAVSSDSSSMWSGSGRFNNPLDSTNQLLQSPNFIHPARQSPHGYDGGSRDDNFRVNSGDRINREGYSNTRFVGSGGGSSSTTTPASHDRGRLQIDPGSDWPPQHDNKETIQFRDDMDNLADWASKIYNFATRASPGIGMAPSHHNRAQRDASERQFDTILDHARSIVSTLQLWRDQGYAISTLSQAHPTELSGLMRTSTSSTGGDAPPRNGDDLPLPGALPYPPSGTQYLMWDKNDEKAMKFRKRSGPKSAIIADQTLNVSAPRAAPPGKCHSCNISETPEWRRGPDGARTLCNACGLHFAKLTKKKQQSLKQDAAARAHR